MDVADQHAERRVGLLTKETVKHIIALLVAIYLSSLFLHQLLFLVRTYELYSFFFIEAITNKRGKRLSQSTYDVAERSQKRTRRQAGPKT
jgi:hypothetical protein